MVGAGEWADLAGEGFPGSADKNVVDTISDAVDKDAGLTAGSDGGGAISQEGTEGEKFRSKGKGVKVPADNGGGFGLLG